MSDTAENIPPPVKRRRRNPFKEQSIYLLPSPPRSLASSLLHVPQLRERSFDTDGPSLDEDELEDTGRDTEQEDDKGKIMLGKMHHRRTVRGWETRRDKVLRARASLTASTPGPDAESAAQQLPDDDLLVALHHHASTFYTSHSLLVTPKKQVRAEQWGSKKRLLLEADGVGSDGRQTGAQVSESDTADGEEAEEAEAAEEGKEVAEEISSDHHNARAEDDHEKTEEQGERGERPGHTGTARQRYKKRDMYKAMDGSALLALGVLVEEHVVRELARAGYVAPLSGLPADGTDPVESSGALSLLNVPRKSPHENDDDGEDDEHDDEDEHDNDYDDDDESEGPV